MENNIQIFEGKKIRSVWDNEKEEWYFSVVDVVGALADSVNARDYWYKMKKRMTDVADIQGIFRVIQSIPSPKAEPFKMWLAQVGKDRIDEITDPELTIDRALETYLKKGYSKEWINQRLQAIQVRKELTDAWQEHGVKKGIEYAILTDEISKAWSGLATREYKDLKGLKKENLRDNMSTLELVLNMLAEATTTELTNIHNPNGLEENKKVAKRGGTIAGNTRKEIEADTGKSVITTKNAVDFSKLIEDVVKDIPDIVKNCKNEEKSKE